MSVPYNLKGVAENQSGTAGISLVSVEMRVFV
jgi:hypothetical protein